MLRTSAAVIAALSRLHVIPKSAVVLFYALRTAAVVDEPVFPRRFAILVFSSSPFSPAAILIFSPGFSIAERLGEAAFASALGSIVCARIAMSIETWPAGTPIYAIEILLAKRTRPPQYYRLQFKFHFFPLWQF